MLCVECCSGNGEWIAARAKEQPENRWIAIEKDPGRTLKIWKRIEREQIANLFLMNGAAEELFATQFAEDSIDRLYINFPDPWPKRRHAKYRLMQPAFVLAIHHVLKVGGQLFFVSDDLAYVESTIKLLRQRPGLKPLAEAPFFCSWSDQEYGSSFFSMLWQEKGRAIYCIPFEKNAPDPL